MHAKQNRWIDENRESGRDIARQGTTEGGQARKEAREREKNQFIEPNNCSRRSSTVHCISDDDPTLCEVEWERGRCGRILKDPESVPFDNVSIRRPICAELLKNTYENTQVAVRQITPRGYTK